MLSKALIVLAFLVGATLKVEAHHVSFDAYPQEYMTHE